MIQITALQALHPVSHIGVLDNHGVAEPEKTYHAIQKRRTARELESYPPDGRRPRIWRVRVQVLHVKFG